MKALVLVALSAACLLNSGCSGVSFGGGEPANLAGDTGTPGGGGNGITGTALGSTQGIYLTGGTALYSMNPQTQAITQLADLIDPVNGATVINGVALTQNGTLYGTMTEFCASTANIPGCMSSSTVQYNTIYKINPNAARGTASLTSVVNLCIWQPNGSGGYTMCANPVSIGSVQGIVMKDDTHMVLAANGLYILDLNAGTVTAIANTQGHQTTGDIAYMPDGNLYWTADGTSSGTSLYKVNPTLGGVTLVGIIPKSYVGGLANVNGSLIGFDLSDGGSFFNLSTVDGSISNVTMPPTSETWYGATSTPTYF